MGPDTQEHHGLQDKVRLSPFASRFLSVLTHIAVSCLLPLPRSVVLGRDSVNKPGLRMESLDRFPLR